MANVIINNKNNNYKYKTDIKGSRKSSKWLLVEHHKIIEFDTKIYIIGILNGIPDEEEFEEDLYKFIDHKWNVEILGFALNKDLADPTIKNGWIEFKANERLIGTSLLKSCKGKNKTLSYSDFQKLLKNSILNTVLN